ncbi:predicted protein [Botrytis cinerea T4]|uniref:Uncharacterized protein n=1 Tax=Botryotinia fuckeliana (strain T4) TaxID=999810 RepID=G2XRC1_BOTF4|nr:predicted protein [Botrytis cinerea T4]
MQMGSGGFPEIRPMPGHFKVCPWKKCSFSSITSSSIFRSLIDPLTALRRKSICRYPADDARPVLYPYTCENPRTGRTQLVAVAAAGFRIGTKLAKFDKEYRVGGEFFNADLSDVYQMARALHVYDKL